MRTKKEIEKLYREYPVNKIKFKKLLIPKITSVLSFAPKQKGNDSKVETNAIAKVEVETDIVLIETCMELMNEIEKEFISLRYFNNIHIKIIADGMHVSRAEVYNIRDRIIKKTKDIIQ